MGLLPRWFHSSYLFIHMYTYLYKELSNRVAITINNI